MISLAGTRDAFVSELAKIPDVTVYGFVPRSWPLLPAMIVSFAKLRGTALTFNVHYMSGEPYSVESTFALADLMYRTFADSPLSVIEVASRAPLTFEPGKREMVPVVAVTIDGVDDGV